jgi:hypothetical protein
MTATVRKYYATIPAVKIAQIIQQTGRVRHQTQEVERPTVALVGRVQLAW